MDRRSHLASRLYFVAAAVLAFSTLLPWATQVEKAPFGVSIQETLKLGGSGIAYLLAFAAAYGGAGYALRRGSTVRRLGLKMWIVNAWMVFNVAVLQSAVSDQAHAIGVLHPSTRAGAGVLAAGAAVIAGIAATVTLRRSGSLVAPVAAH